MGMKNYCYTPDYCGELNNSVERLTGEKSQLESENADLQAKLEGAKTKISYLEDQRDKGIEYETKLERRVLAAEQERDNLQAQVGVLTEALKPFADVYIFALEDNGTQAYEIDTASVKRAQDALSFTPAEAGERVQYLVTVATDVLGWLQQNKLGDTGHGRCLADALEKYRGGAA